MFRSSITDCGADSVGSVPIDAFTSPRRSSLTASLIIVAAEESNQLEINEEFEADQKEEVLFE